MKKGALIVILSLLLVLIPITFGLMIINFNLKLESSREIQAEIASGKASQSNIAMAISVVGSPYLKIISPINGTYLISQGIPLKFESDEKQFIWYNIDNQQNITLQGNRNINTTEGVHTLYLYANNTHGFTQKSVVFTVNSTKVKFIMDEFNEDYEVSDESHSENRKKDKKGNTTPIFDYTFEEIQGLDDFILDDSLNAKVEFNEPVNLTDTEDFANKIINFTKSVNFSYNYIEINSTSFPGLNRFATLTLRNLTFNNPRILKNGEICSDLECIIVNYSEGELIFMAEGFSYYSAEETPEESQSPPRGGGGGGGLLPWMQYNFNLDAEQLSIKLKQGETDFQSFKITNNGKQKITLTIEESLNIKDFLKIDPEKITLTPGESKIINLDFIVREDTIPGMYLGKIMIKSDSERVEKTIIVGLEVTTKNPLFDVRIYIPEKYLGILPGEEIYYSVEIFNLGDIDDEIDIEVEYSLLDEQGKTVTSHHESMAVRTKLSYIRQKEVPDHLPFGDYVIYLKVLYAGQVSSTSQMITLGPHKETEYPLPKFFYVIPMVISIIALVILILFFIILIKLSKKQRKFKRVVLKKLKRR